ncbi:Eco57I restriction-modification methylase domain-containing protein [Peptacetobacter sp.]|uniref:Eco57I restriction-modification methylase domain-containing protein n=1 Tax=Peptacetobacter sp. TaxID=2991975 RepID=UPI0026178829|nr:N-6 DNA methylase [Peptacetobacter sp.]
MDKFEDSRIYEKSLDIEKRKRYGIYYTPKEVVEYIVDDTIKDIDVIENPCPKILDSSCGCGNFLLEVFEKLKIKFIKNSDKLLEKYNNDIFKEENIPKYILENCIYATDIDKKAVEIAKKLLLEKANIERNENVKLNIYIEDGLKIKWNTKFDVIIGNPPYVGHKHLTKEYKEFILEEYKDVYKDKSDLYFCFYKNSLDILKDNGVIHLITPRYFLESMSAFLLREYIQKNAEIEELIDFLGDEVFTYIGISACIIKMRKKGYGIEKTNIYRKKSDKYVCMKKRKSEISIKELKEKDEIFERLIIDTEKLQSNWIIANEKDMDLYLKIEEKAKYRLSDIAESFQGIITGCDKAFILKKDDDRIKNIDSKLLKQWVKNKDIDKYVIKNINYKLIYSNDIDNDEEYDYALETCIKPYKKKLENRRECLKGIRKWYELQWGREKKLFERKKVMYPYKSRDNKFALDYDNLYSSADVYSFYLKEECEKIFSYEYIVALLNSSIYDRYYKIGAKKMSRGIYDYYPNKVMDIKILKGDNYKKIENYSKKIMEKKDDILDNINNSIQKSTLEKEKYLLENKKKSDEIKELIKDIDLLIEEDIFN